MIMSYNSNELAPNTRTGLWDRPSQCGSTRVGDEIRKKRVHIVKKMNDAREARLSHISLRLLLEEGPGLLEEGLALGGLAANHLEALDAEGLARALHGLGPLAEAVLLVPPLARRGTLLGHDLALLVADQVRLLQAAHGAGLLAAEHAALGHLGHALLHGPLLHATLHGLHGLHALLGLHGLLHRLRHSGERGGVYDSLD